MASILIVEDDADCLDALASVVASEGYDVVTANDAKSALQLLSSPMQPALMLLDLHMPGAMSGFELLDEKARSADLAGIPTVLISGAEVDDAVRAYAASGVVASLRKPLEPDSVLGAIERYGPACTRSSNGVGCVDVGGGVEGDDVDGPADVDGDGDDEPPGADVERRGLNARQRLLAIV